MQILNGKYISRILQLVRNKADIIPNEFLYKKNILITLIYNCNFLDTKGPRFYTEIFHVYFQLLVFILGNPFF